MLISAKPVTSKWDLTESVNLIIKIMILFTFYLTIFRSM